MRTSGSHACSSRMLNTTSRPSSWPQPSGATQRCTRKVSTTAAANAGIIRASRLRKNRPGRPLASDAHAK